MGDAAPKVRTCLWVRSGGRAAAAFYVSLLPGSQLEIALEGDDAGDPLLVNFTLAGTPFQMLTAGGHNHDLTPATSISVVTEDQAETDRLWDALLSDGGSEMACGWLTDRFGLSWQIVPRRLMELQQDADPARAARAMQAMMQMVKIDIAALDAAAGPGGA